MSEVKSERMLLCDALDERDFLAKKISKAIADAQFVGAKRIKDTKVNSSVTAEEFGKNAKASYQSIRDNIHRYERLVQAITLSNATTEIETRSGKKMTRAAAIAFRNSINGINGEDFVGELIKALKTQRDTAVSKVNMLNLKADTELETYKNNVTSGDKKQIDADMLQGLEKLVANLYGELVDDIGVDKAIEELSSDYDTLRKEIDSAIKVSNATTYIEF